MSSGRHAARRLRLPLPSRGDFVAGLSVALILIPQGMAYAQLAGLPPIHGLYAAADRVGLGGHLREWPEMQQRVSAPGAARAPMRRSGARSAATPARGLRAGSSRRKKGARRPKEASRPSRRRICEVCSSSPSPTRWMSGGSSAKGYRPMCSRQQSSGSRGPRATHLCGLSPHQCNDGVAGRVKVLIEKCSDQDRVPSRLLHPGQLHP